MKFERSSSSSQLSDLSANECCTVSTVERYSCHRVVDEQGKPYKECTRTREVVRHCLGRPAEVLESHTHKTVEDVCAGAGKSEQYSAWQGSWSSGDALGTDGSLQEPSPLPGPSHQAPPAPLGPHASSWPFGVPQRGALDGGAPGLGSGPGPGPGPSMPALLQDLVRSSEEAARSILDQFGKEVEELQPFRGIRGFFQIPAARCPEDDDQPRPSDTPSAGAPSVTQDGTRPGDSGGMHRQFRLFGRKEARKSYEEYAKDFEEV